MDKIVYFKRYIVHVIINICSLIRFLISPVKQNTVLLIEPNSCHAELFPSYVKYFKDLGFKVDIIAHIGHMGYLPKLDVNNIFYFTFFKSRKIFNLEKIRKYEFILFQSFRFYFKAQEPKCSRAYSTLFEHFKIEDSLRCKTAAVFHHLEDMTKAEGADKLARCILLSDNLKDKVPDFLQDKTIFVNPWYFKENAPKDKNKKTTFAITGSIAIDRKNPEILFDGVRKLLDEGIENFEVILVGINPKNCIPKDLRNVIKNKGGQSFERLYKILGAADFYIPLLDPEFKEHLRYISMGTSGSFQLIRGFLLPPVIHKVFGDAHGFNENNALVYAKNSNFADTLRMGIQMDNAQCLKLQRKILEERTEIYNSGLASLKNIF